LQRQGYRVLTASDPVQAVQLSKLHPGAIDLLLTDVIMPHGSGRWLADELMPECPEMKVVYLSGYTNSVVLDHGVPEGAVFLQKPVLPETLSRTVRAVLEGRSNPKSRHASRA